MAPVYDPNTVTHIITDTNVKITLKALGLKSLDEIPFHIPTLRWTWISNRSDHHLFLHAAFAKRIDCGPEEVYPVPKRKKKDTRQAQDDWEFSRIEFVVNSSCLDYWYLFHMLKGVSHFFT